MKVYWAKAPDYFSFTPAAKDDNKVARCTKQNTTFNLSKIGEQTLKSHIKRKKHSQAIDPEKFF